MTSLDDVLTERLTKVGLAKVGLIRRRESALLAGFIDAYVGAGPT